MPEKSLLTSLRGANQEKIKVYNETLVLRTICACQPVSQREIAEQTGLQSSTTSIILDRLLRIGILRKTSGERSGLPGRISKPIILDPDYRHVIGLGLGRHEHVIVIGNFNGEILTTTTIGNCGDPGQDLNVLVRHIRQLRRAHPIPIGAIGISCPGTVDPERARVVHSAVLVWRDIDLACLTRFENCPLYMDHDARLGAFAEIWRSHCAYPQNFAYLLVREGLGVGLVIGGRVYCGRNQHGSEFGHVTLDPRGPQCRCGRRGCWESYVAEQAALDRYSGKTQTNKCSSLCDLIERALDGERLARKALLTTGDYLGRGIATLSCALNLDQIIVGGELSRVWMMIEPAIRRALDRVPLAVDVKDLPIAASRFGAAGHLQGAVGLALERYIPWLPQYGLGSDGLRACKPKIQEQQ